MKTSDDGVPGFSPWPKRGATRGERLSPAHISSGCATQVATSTSTIPRATWSDRYFRGRLRRRLRSSCRSIPTRRPIRSRTVPTALATTISTRSHRRRAIRSCRRGAWGAATECRGADGTERARSSTAARSPDGSRRHRAHGEQAISTAVQRLWRSSRPRRRAGLAAPGTAPPGAAGRAPTGLEHLVGVELSASSWSASSWSANSWERIELERKQLVGLVVSGSTGGGWHGATWGLT